MTAAKQTQLDKIKAELLAGCRVDSITAFGHGITRLSSIIKRLRDRGLPVIADCDHNNGLARYRLPDDYLATNNASTLPKI